MLSHGHFVIAAAAVVDIRGECLVAGCGTLLRDAAHEAREQACGSCVHFKVIRVQQRECGVKPLSLQQQARARHVARDFPFEFRARSGQNGFVVAESHSCDEFEDSLLVVLA